MLSEGVSEVCRNIELKEKFIFVQKIWKSMHTVSKKVDENFIL